MYVRGIALCLVLGCTTLLGGCLVAMGVNLASGVALEAVEYLVTKQNTRVTPIPHPSKYRLSLSSATIASSKLASSLASSGLPACSGSSQYWSNCIGIKTYNNGNKYIGQFLKGIPYGQGTLLTASGVVTKQGIWDGAFKYDKTPTVTVAKPSVTSALKVASSGLPACSGSSQYWSNCFGQLGDYIGEFKNDKFHGQGTWYYSNGTVKKGIWENGNFLYVKKPPVTPTVIVKKPSVTSSPKVASSGLPQCPSSGTWDYCFGTYTFADGTKYVGEWKNDKRHGQGTYTYSSGTVKEGIWERGNFKYAKKTPVTPTVIAKKPSVTPAPAPAPKLVSSTQVFRSQEALQVLGLYSGKLDGLAGSGTANAIKEWQQRTGLPKTGEVTELQLARLESEAIRHVRKTNSEPVSIASVKDIKSGEIKSDKYAGIEFGNYHALVIGINEYKHLPKLKTAVNDAEAVADVLKNNYGFDVNLLRNAKHSELIDALDDYESNLGVNDNLLIYYAGHGDLDKAGGEGYWHPADARKGKRGSWISNSSISTRLKALKARHVIVVADSCYSGNLLRSGDTSVDNRVKDVRRLNLKRSRGALTSGGLEPVVDSVGGNHSPFAKAFINALNDNKDVVDMATMYPLIRKSVGLSTTKQTPEFSAVIDTNHEGGDFFFVRRK